MNIFCQILWTQNRWNLLDIFNRFLNMNFSILEFLTVRLTVYLNLDLKKLVCIESVVKLFILKMLGSVFFCRKLRTYWPVSSSWVMGEHIHLGRKDLKFEKWGSLSLKILTPLCQAHQGVRTLHLNDRLSRQNRNRIENSLSLFIRGLACLESWKIEVGNLVTSSLEGKS